MWNPFRRPAICGRYVRTRFNTLRAAHQRGPIADRTLPSVGESPWRRSDRKNVDMVIDVAFSEGKVDPGGRRRSGHRTDLVSGCQVAKSSRHPLTDPLSIRYPVVCDAAETVSPAPPIFFLHARLHG